MRINWTWLIVGVLLGFVIRHYMAGRTKATA